MLSPAPGDGCATLRDVRALEDVPSVAFVGLGYATRALHLPATRAAAARPAGGTDPDPARRAAFTAATGTPAFATLDELLERTRPDVVVVATPPASHAQVCVQVLDAGANVLCEKPFVETVEQADEVLAAAARTGGAVAVNHEFRYMPIFAALRGAVGQERSGQAVFLSCVQFMDLAPWEEAVPWRAAMPHRSLFEGGIHIVDLVHMVLGRGPRRVTAHVSSGLDTSRVADAIHLVTLDHGDGVLAQITIDRLCRAGTRYVDIRVDCERESLRASYGGRALLQVGVKRGERPGVRLDVGLEGLAWAERGRRRRVLARNPRRSAARATGALHADVYDHWRRGEQPPTSALTARETLRTVRAAYASAASGVQQVLEPAPAAHA